MKGYLGRLVKIIGFCSSFSGFTKTQEVNGRQYIFFKEVSELGSKTKKAVACAELKISTSHS